MSDWLSIEEGEPLGGLRVLLYRGLPSPWSQAAIAMFKLRNVSYTPVTKSDSDDDQAIFRWTGQDSYPAAVFNDEPACTSWSEILFLVERLGSGPSLLPQDPFERALNLGLCHEVFGQMGFCWSRRLMLFSGILSSPNTHPGTRAFVEVLAKKYRYNETDAAAAGLRVADILRVLSQQLADQRARGSEYFIGDTLSALDIIWAVSTLFLQPLSQEDCALPEGLRRSYELSAEDIGMEIDSALIAHRDRIYRQHLALPVVF